MENNNVEKPTKSLWRIEYKHGLANPTNVMASSYDEAMKMGLAEYRRIADYTDTVSFFPIDMVVKSATLLETL